ncbi:uncharacterized protein [Centruroides vittatus]|uniref:uncharacterized protein n=1 Tax=Centruroides vittatus TaxID=120091 RepID=UPI00350EAA69
MFWSKEFWPPNSPDLNPLDFYVWSVVERVTNKTRHANITSLRAAIDAAFTNINQELNKIGIEETFRVASLDIVDMYPSVTWEIIENKLQQLKVDEEILDLIDFTYRSNYFEIDGNYYTQQEGISMGSVIGPKLAELITIEIDEIISKIPGIKFYRRYVDDVLIMCNKTEITIEDINKHINSITKEYPLD